MRDTDENGYYNTTVNGSAYTIKGKHMGSRLDSTARRLAAYDDVCRVRVEYDGVVSFSVREESAWSAKNIVPDGFIMADMLVHNGDGAHARIYMEADSV